MLRASDEARVDAERPGDCSEALENVGRWRVKPCMKAFSSGPENGG